MILILRNSRLAKKITAVTLIAMSLTLTAAPMWADENVAPVSEVAKAANNLEADAHTLDQAAINQQGILYLPLLSTLEAMGAQVTKSPDKQEAKLKLTLSDGNSYQLYYNKNAQGKNTVATKNNVAGATLLVRNGVGYVPLSFIQSLTNRAVTVYDKTLRLVEKTPGTTTAVWNGTMEKYTIDPNEQIADGSAVIGTARTCLGVPYVWGGTTMAGFDCSGLTSYVFARNGIALPRTAAAQQAYAKPISMSELRAGDLVFWGAPAYHVGIYIGNGQYIHAPAPGQVVTVQSSAYYPFTSAGRVL